MFFGGELRSSVGISHGSENFGFRCLATPIILALIPMFANVCVWLVKNLFWLVNQTCQ